MKKHKNKIIAAFVAVLTVIICILVYICTFKPEPSIPNYTASPTASASADANDNVTKNDTDATFAPAQPTSDISENEHNVSAPPVSAAPSSAPLKESELTVSTTPIPTHTPHPTASNISSVADTDKTVASNEKKEQTCTLSVVCSSILNNLDKLSAAKANIIPTDGIIFSERDVDFHEGDSVFGILKREMKRNKIHMEFINTPVYKSAYVEGIGNIYEFDCGELSGWVYKVNDIFPNCSASKYYPQVGDRIEWVYTCDLGADVGGSSATFGGQKDE